MQCQILRRPLFGRQTIDGAEFFLHIVQWRVGFARSSCVHSIFERVQMSADGIRGIRSEFPFEFIIVQIVNVVIVVVRVIVVIIVVIVQQQIFLSQRSKIIQLPRPFPERIQYHLPLPTGQTLYRHVRIAVQQVRVIHRRFVDALVVISVMGGDPLFVKSLAPSRCGGVFGFFGWGRRQGCGGVGTRSEVDARDGGWGGATRFERQGASGDGGVSGWLVCCVEYGSP
mmetsp:Transcript_34038/g.71619  ORF Transcript_34038/g.71619 Transcript_34038/m.71619 type:complete len:227 (+) Transcript_34038:670-1350(+)